ncbi:hypothetical protein IG389_07915 [Idiomarina abyssalis]|jgi:predicted RNase H-like nuclease (RuvC/YqgF family)|uniref:Uncharacterized protein n=1 Tax=Idiomarina abyssalis TaxID=86102 RepID=A0A8I1G5K8_9GAMM|nr:hypothetical protein [Idiomarina abyssalis]MAL84303.1 hypothetical protein [Idiomarina sp.]MBJ7265659.1 hypothetical protein [Idiomarina abyssalis]MBJ7273843.1 hypothetical protein [Idiomarina abyssalis]MBJ7314451.1 hypothetical protein [Idiomarina abyssalis]
MERRLNDTERKLTDAFNRILRGCPQIISKKRKLSVKAVEDEANLGRNSAFHYEQLRAEIAETVASMYGAKLPRPAYSAGKSEDHLALRREIKKLKTENEELKLKNERQQEESDKLSSQLATLAKHYKLLQKEHENNKSLLKQANDEIAEFKRSKVAVLNH